MLYECFIIQNNQENKIIVIFDINFRYKFKYVRIIVFSTNLYIKNLR